MITDQAGEPLLEAFTSTGLTPPAELNTVPRTIFDEPDTGHSYDQIVWSPGTGVGPAASLTYTGNAGGFDFSPPPRRDAGDAKVEPAVPVSDMAKAQDFYETKLGFSGGRPIFDGGITYPCGGGREIHIYPSPANASKAGGTIAAWEVVDLEKTVDEVTANGVIFEHYDSDRLKTNEKGIAELGDERAAWFKDPDGNAYGIVQL